MSIRQDCSKSLAVKKINIKATRSHYFVPKGDGVGVVVKETVLILVRMQATEEVLTHHWWACKIVQLLWESLAVSFTAECVLTLGPPKSHFWALTQRNDNLCPYKLVQKCQ